MASSSSPRFTLLYVDLLLTLGGIPPVRFCVSQIPDIPILTLRPKRILLRNDTLFDPKVVGQGLQILCKVPQSFRGEQLGALTLYFTAAYGPQAGRRVKVAGFNSSVTEGRLDVAPALGVRATGGTRRQLIDYRVAKATCQNAGTYGCQLTSADNYASTSTARFIYSLPPGDVRTQTGGLNNTVLVLKVGHEYDVNCTASVGTVAGEQVLWVWEFLTSKEVSNWQNVTNTNTVTTRSLNTFSSYYRCLATVQVSTFTIKPRNRDTDGKYRCYVWKNGVSFRNFAGVFKVHRYHPVKRGLFGATRVWVIVLGATVSILFMVLIIVLIIARKVNKSIKHMPGSIPQASFDYHIGTPWETGSSTPVHPKRRGKGSEVDDLARFIDTSELKLAKPNRERSSYVDSSGSSSRRASEVKTRETKRSRNLSQSTRSDDILQELQKIGLRSGLSPTSASGEGHVSLDSETSTEETTTV